MRISLLELGYLPNGRLTGEQIRPVDGALQAEYSAVDAYQVDERVARCRYGGPAR